MMMLMVMVMKMVEMMKKKKNKDIEKNLESCTYDDFGVGVAQADFLAIYFEFIV